MYCKLNLNKENLFISPGSFSNANISYHQIQFINLIIRLQKRKFKDLNSIQFLHHVLSFIIILIQVWFLAQ